MPTPSARTAEEPGLKNEPGKTRKDKKDINDAKDIKRSDLFLPPSPFSSHPFCP